MSPRATRSWRDLRIDAGLTLRQVEVLSSLNRGMISQIERGRMCVTPDQAQALLDVYRNPTRRPA